MARDLADCRKEASSRYPITAALPSSSPDPRFAGPVGPSPADRQMQIQMSVTSCMRARGYALIPASG